LFKKILHEPLVHFLVLGALIFFLYAMMNPAEQNDADTIVISKAEQKQMAYRWQKKHMRLPTEDEMQKMIDKEVYTEVMYREALKMGLDKNDFIVRRRMAQKLEFISSDLSSLLEPSDEALKKYLSAHSKMFRQPGSITFDQVYIDVSRHRNDLQETLKKVKKALDTNKSVETVGDSFMLPSENQALSQSEVIRIFGKKFEYALKTLKERSWEGPVKSGYGLHFVYIKKREEGALPPFESVRASLKSAWMSEQKEKNSQLFYETLKKAYRVEIEK